MAIPTSKQDEKIANMLVSSIYPAYLNKIEKKNRSEEELQEIIQWLTNYDKKQLEKLIEDKVTFKTFFENAKLNPKAKLIEGSICGHKVQEIQNPLTQQVRYLDKLVDELAKGKSMDKILRHNIKDTSE